MSLQALVVPLASLVLVAVTPQAVTPDAVAPQAFTHVGPKLLVLNKSDNTLAYYSGDARNGVVPTGRGPHEVAVSPDQKLAVVADYGDRTAGKTLTVVQLHSGTVLRTIDLGEYTRPHGIVFSGPRRVLVTSETTKKLVEVDIEQGSVVRAMDTGQDASHMVAVTPDGELAFVANIGSGSVSVIELDGGELLQVIETGAGSEGIDVSPDGKECWVTNRSADTVSVIDVEQLEVVATVDVSAEGRDEAFPIRVKLTPDGKRALVSNATAGEVVAIDVATRKVVARLAMDLPVVDDPEGRLFQVEDSPMPVGILIEPGGARAYVANTNADIVTVIDLAKFEIEKRIETGREPDGMAWAVVSTW